MMTSSEQSSKIVGLSLAVVGDISFAGPKADIPSGDIFKSILPVLDQADIVIGNLEGPLFDESRPVAGKCTIRGCTGWAGVLKEAGFHVVSLANNHIMDHGKAGLFSTISALEKEGIKAVGAGANIDEACKPIFHEINGYRLAILARTSVIVNSPSYADHAIPGVAFLNIEELLKNVKKCRPQCDAVVLLMHWGVEHYAYPNPDQRKKAKELIKAGVDIIIGHHPHIVQGCERFNDGLAAYSLGNFVFDEFAWSEKLDDDSNRKLILSLTHANRRGMILTFTIKNKQIQYAPVFTRIEKNGYISEDSNPQRKTDFDKLCGRFRHKDYDRWWKFYALKKEWELRFRRRITLKNLTVKILLLRPRHIRELFQVIRNSFRITSGKSTNPYE